jgi:hypothetical protein
MAPPAQYAQYFKNPATPDALQGSLTDKWLFVGLDLAPNETLESGVTVVDRDRQLLRMDKLYSDQSILTYIQGLGPAHNLIVVIDMPKNLGISGRWRQEEVKLHPLRLARFDGSGLTDRYAKRSRELYDTLLKLGAMPILYFSAMARLSYDMYIPFRIRTPQGCRALQAMVKERLKLGNMPTNLAPSSVLDAMIACYCAWGVYQGQFGQHYDLFTDESGRAYLRPLKLYTATQKVRRRRRYFGRR